MKNVILSTLFMLALLPAAGLSQKTAPAEKPVQVRANPAYEIPIKVKTLANGMQIIVLPDSSVPLVTIELAVRNGSFTEPPELNGLSHLYEHMFFKPSRRCPYCGGAICPLRNRAFKQYDCDREMLLKPGSRTCI